MAIANEKRTYAPYAKYISAASKPKPSAPAASEPKQAA